MVVIDSETVVAINRKHRSPCPGARRKGPIALGFIANLLQDLSILTEKTAPVLYPFLASGCGSQGEGAS